MAEGSLRLRSIRDYWNLDKALLRRSYGELPLHWDGVTPDVHDVSILATAAADASLHVSDTDHVATLSSVDALVEELVPQIETLWQAHLSDKPLVSVHPFSAYRALFHELQIDFAQHTGVEVASDSPDEIPPAIALFPHKGIIVVSDTLIATHSDGVVASVHLTPWKKELLELVLVQTFTTALYSQMRGDWKDGFSSASFCEHPSSQYILPALQLHTTEYLARSSYPEWAVQIVYRKIAEFYRDPAAMQVYKTLDVLSEQKSFAQLAMISGLDLDATNGRLAIRFKPDHPQAARHHAYFQQSQGISS